jgi:hypothetical protein
MTSFELVIIAVGVLVCCSLWIFVMACWEGVEAVTIDIIMRRDIEGSAPTSFAPKSAGVLICTLPHYAKALYSILCHYGKAWENDGRVQRTKFDGEEVSI